MLRRYGGIYLDVQLPTGGIRTVFHSSQEPAEKKAKFDVNPMPLSAMMECSRSGARLVSCNNNNNR
jgi:hypothetical protein